MDLIQDLHDRIEHDITTDELIAMTNFAIMILRERTDDSINYNNVYKANFNLSSRCR